MQSVEHLGRGRREELAARVEELAEALDLPQLRVLRNPLRRQHLWRALGEVIVRRQPPRSRADSGVMKAKFAMALTSDRAKPCSDELRLGEDLMDLEIARSAVERGAGREVSCRPEHGRAGRATGRSVSRAQRLRSRSASIVMAPLRARLKLAMTPSMPSASTASRSRAR